MSPGSGDCLYFLIIAMRLFDSDVSRAITASRVFGSFANRERACAMSESRCAVLSAAVLPVR